MGKWGSEGLRGIALGPHGANYTKTVNTKTVTFQ